jgi:hypothetical protein
MSIKTKVFGVGVALALLVAAIAGPAGAAPSHTETNNDDDTGFTVNAGTGPRFDTDVPSGTFPIINDFHDVTLNGTPQLTSAEIPPFTIIDDSGTGAGWNVTFTLPDFSGTDVAHPAILDASGASMNAPVLRPGTADSALGGVYTIPQVDFTAGQVIVRADPANLLAPDGIDHVNHGNGYAPLSIDGNAHVAGMGTYLISPQIVKLVVPNTTIADDYTTTANFTIASGP